MDKRWSYSFTKYLRCLSRAPSQAKIKAPPVQHESLEFILKDKLLSELFNDWATQNLCSENLAFYSEVDRYKTIRDPQFMKAEAQRIHNKYVRLRSVAEVNLDYEVRETIEMKLDNPCATIFDEAKFAVLDLIKYDLYQKFLDSDIYRNFKGLPSAHRYPQQRRRNVHLADMPHITYDQISSLSRCLHDPMAMDQFLKFAYTEFSDAVVQFYLDIERYEVFPSLEFACSIFSKYLVDSSEEEVDADPKIKKWILEQIQLGLYPSHLFTTLKLQVYGVMVQDNFMRFQTYVINSLAMV